MGEAGGSTEGVDAPRGEVHEAVGLRELRNDVGGYGDERQADEVRPLAHLRGLEVLGQGDGSELLVLDPEEGGGGFGSLDVADVALGVEDGLDAAGGGGAEIGAGVDGGDLLDDLGTGADVVGSTADVVDCAAGRAVLYLGEGAAGEKCTWEL